LTCRYINKRKGLRKIQYQWLTAIINSGKIRLADTYIAASFDWPPYNIADNDDFPLYYSGQSNFEFEYLGEFGTKFENILVYETGAQVGSIDEKNQR
jgi:hypothetical protein